MLRELLSIVSDFFRYRKNPLKKLYSLDLEISPEFALPQTLAVGCASLGYLVSCRVRSPLLYKGSTLLLSCALDGKDQVSAGFKRLGVFGHCTLSFKEGEPLNASIIQGENEFLHFKALVGQLPFCNGFTMRLQLTKPIELHDARTFQVEKVEMPLQVDTVRSLALFQKTPEGAVIQ